MSRCKRPRTYLGWRGNFQEIGSCFNEDKEPSSSERREGNKFELAGFEKYTSGQAESIILEHRNAAIRLQARRFSSS